MRELGAGRKVRGEWTVVRTIAAGCFGQVYEVKRTGSAEAPPPKARPAAATTPADERTKDTTSVGTASGAAAAGPAEAAQRGAMKVEGRGEGEPLLPLEALVARRFSGQTHAPVFLACGAEETFHWLVEELVGPSLAALRKRGLFSASSGLRLLGQGVEALREFHTSTGFVHRDLKPGNLAMGLPGSGRERCLILLDFGLSRRLLRPDGRVRRPRRGVPFRGSLRYASANAHRQLELGRGDDLWSLLYVFLDLMCPKNLCWVGEQGMGHVGRLKRDSSPAQLVRGLPPSLKQFPRELAGLSYASEPDYAVLGAIVQTSFRSLPGPPRPADPFDWDRGPNFLSSIRRSLSHSVSPNSVSPS